MGIILIMKTAYCTIASPGHNYPGHPEGPDRFSSLEEILASFPQEQLIRLEASPAAYEEILLVHSQEMVNDLKQACRSGPRIIDAAPTYVTPTSFEDARLAAGAALECTRSVMAGRARNAIAIIRPPGHHAEPERAMGFCLFNNLAVAAAEALHNGCHRILIFDFDVHHGNGTQAVFWSDHRAAYFSTHQEHIYPGSGRIDEAPHARGRIVNLPLPPRSGDECFQRITADVLTPLVQRFQPEMLFISAGFDAHWRDPLASLGLSETGFFAIANRLVALAGEFCDGKIVFVLEGGYDPEIVGRGVRTTLHALKDIQLPPTVSDASPYPEPDIRARLTQLLQWHEIM